MPSDDKMSYFWYKKNVDGPFVEGKQHARTGGRYDGASQPQIKSSDQAPNQPSVIELSSPLLMGS